MERNDKNKYVIGITQGDINGIGYEVIFKALQDSDICNDCTFVIYGSPKIAAFHRKLFSLPNFTVNNANNVSELVPRAINVINVCDDNSRVELGINTITAGECSLAAIHCAQTDLKNKNIDILVTAPANQFNINEAGFHFAGFSEFAAQELNCRNFVIMFLGNKLNMATVTSPMPLAAVSQSLTIDKILWKIRTLNKTLRDDFAIRKPKIAVLGFNPFASDYGVFGKEEGEKIHPAILKANEEGIVCFGPFGSDGFFASREYEKFDVVLAMTYDQAITPFRIIEQNSGVQYTGGLPVIVTAPTHGPSYDIAGKGLADETSMRNAIYKAIDIFYNRKMMEGIEPLKKQTEYEADKKIC